MFYASTNKKPNKIATITECNYIFYISSVRCNEYCTVSNMVKATRLVVLLNFTNNMIYEYQECSLKINPRKHDHFNIECITVLMLKITQI